MLKRIASTLPALLSAALLWSGTLCSTRAAEASPEQAQKLIAVLKSDASRKEKADACRELAVSGGPEAVAPLAALLGNEELTHMARYALETIPDASVDAAFREALPQLKGRALVGVVHSLGVRRDTKAVPALAELLGGPDDDVAAAAARALGAIGNAEASQNLVRALAAANQAGRKAAVAEGLFRCAENASANQDSKTAAGIYEEMLKAELSPQARAGALEGLIVAQGKEGIPTLSRALSGSDPSLFAAALRASGKVAGPETTEALVKLLPGLTAERQVMLIQVLSGRRAPESLPALLQVARSGEKAVRLAAIRALGEQGQASSATALFALALEPDSELANGAGEACAGLPGASVDQLVVEKLQSGTNREQALALQLLSRRRMTNAVPVLVELARGGSPLQGAMLRAVGELGSASEIPVLLALLREAPSEAGREAAEQALSTLAHRVGNSPELTAALAARLKEGAKEEQLAVLRILGGLGNADALKLVGQAAQGQQPELRATALRVLCNWPGLEAAPLLLETAGKSTDETERSLAVQGYLRLAVNHEASPATRQEMCQQASRLAQKPAEKKLLLSALGTLNTFDSLQLILPFLEQSDLRAEAATAALNVSRQLLAQKASTGKAASRLIAPLEKVAANAPDESLKKRANALLEEAKKKGNLAKS